MTANAGHKGNFFLKWLEEAEGSRIKRTFNGPWNLAFRILAALYSVVLITSVVSNVASASTLRGLFILAITSMIFLRYPAAKSSPLNKPSWVDLGLIGLGVLAFGNFILDYEEMAWRAGSASPRDLFFGVIAIGLVLEACRRSMSLILPTLALVLVLYAYSGPYIPGDLFGHQGFGLDQIIGDTYASMNGIFGFVAYVFIAYVMLFVIMGAIFERFGAGDFFIGLPVALMARFRGGSAKAAVVSSCLFGMISGSATANTVATGTFTIPMMKRSGYRPQVAGAVEAASSTGGMFMPPVMGAGAFLMAEMMHIPYSDIVKAALVPALLYFFSILVMVHFEALKSGITAIPEDERERPRDVLRRGWFYLVPLAVLFGVLFTGSTASLAAFAAIASFIGIMFIRYLLQGDLKGFFRALFDALAEGGDKSLIVGSTAGPVGIIVGMVLLTGIAFKFSALLLGYTFGMPWLALVIVMLATFVLGMGMTVTADYLILAVLAVPAMGELGIPLLAAHFAVFWFSQSSNVTPPVCMAAFAGASIAQANPYETGFHAMRFSAFLYLMPFMFVYTPMLMPNGLTLEVIYSWTVLFLSAIPFAAGMTGYFYGNLRPLQRGALIVSAALLVFPSVAADIVAILLLLGTTVPQYLRSRQIRAQNGATAMSEQAVGTSP